MKIKFSHPVIQAIDKADIDDELKLLAYNGIDAIKDAFPEDTTVLSGLFLWTDSELGHEFWNDLDNIIYIY